MQKFSDAIQEGDEVLVHFVGDCIKVDTHRLFLPYDVTSSLPDPIKWGRELVK